MSHVDTEHGGWTELRVHGVSGTPPEDMLGHPHVRLVAGNAQAGFYRRAWESRRSAEDSPSGRLEAYSWGGLTSGDNRRALWLLLLPFMLLNVAFFMVPCRVPPERRRGRGTQRFSGSVQRLFALSFTLTFALTVVSVSMDLLGWQCGAGPAAGGPQECLGGSSWLSWLDWSWLDARGRQLAVTALLPVAAFLVLWRLASSTWRNLERTEVPQGGTAPDVRTPLEDRAMWNGRRAVRRLRALHVSAGLAVPGVLLAAALLPQPSRGLAALADREAWDSPSAAVRATALVALLALLAGVAVTAAWPNIASRTRPAYGDERERLRLRREEEAAEGRSPLRVLPWVALALTGTAALAALPDSAGAGAPVGGGLPWLVGAILGLFAVQVALVALLVLACALLRRLAPPRSGEGVDLPPVWRGLGMPAVAVLGWLLSGGLSAGVVLRVADTLGSPVVAGEGGGDALVVPTAYYWVAVAGLAAGLLALVLGAVAYARLRSPSGEVLELVDAAYPEAGTNPDRRADIARQWTQARGVTGLVQRLSGVFLAGVAALVAAGIVLYLVLGTRLLTHAPLLVTVAGLALSAFVLGVLWVGRQAYRNPAFRRTVGIAWDLGTFWPRAVHPLAPPCYAERAVPDLLGRLDLLAHDPDGRRALLSCHSQGTVIGAAVLLQAEESVSANTCFLTYGSPLARLYQRFFPAYFGRPALERLERFLADPVRGGARWCNLYRQSDPIGGPVLAEPGGRSVDRELVDPVFARERGNPCYPTTLGHSDYFADPAFAATVAELRDPPPPLVPDGHVPSARALTSS